MNKKRIAIIVFITIFISNEIYSNIISVGITTDLNFYSYPYTNIYDTIIISLGLHSLLFLDIFGYEEPGIIINIMYSFLPIVYGVGDNYALNINTPIIDISCLAGLAWKLWLTEKSVLLAGIGGFINYTSASNNYNFQDNLLTIGTGFMFSYHFFLYKKMLFYMQINPIWESFLSNFVNYKIVKMGWGINVDMDIGFSFYFE